MERKRRYVTRIAAIALLSILTSSLGVGAAGMAPPERLDSRPGIGSDAGSDTEVQALPSSVLDPDAVGWYSGRNFTSSAFSDWFSDLAEQGYMMVDIEVDEIDGVQRVGGVWQRNTDGRGWFQTRNMTLAEFELTQRERADAGYRLIDQEVYVLGTGTFYAGIWIQNVEGLNWTHYYDMTSDEFSALFDFSADQGFVPIDVDAYVIDGELLYSAIWVENTENLAWRLWRDLTSEGFAEKFDEYRDRFRMIDVESYQFQGRQLFAGIWLENANGRGWAQWRNLTSQGFHAKWSELRDAGFRLINYEVYPTAAGWRYAGIWRQNGDRFDWDLKGDVDALVEEYFNDNNIAGMSIAIAHDGQFRYLRGLGHADIANNVATDSRTIYRLASISKAVGGTLGVRLAQLGLLDLSAASRDYVPELPAAHTHTVLQTLNNRSGVGHYPAHPSIVDSYATAGEAAAQLWDTPPVLPTGVYTYSTHAYTYAGASMERAPFTLMPISGILDLYLRTTFDLNTLRAEDRSVPHPKRSLLYAQVGGMNQEVSADDISWKVLGGGMESSVYDLVRFGMRLTDGTILAEPFLDLMWTAPDASANYAVGWGVGTHLGSEVVAKSGRQNGARCYIRVYPDENIWIAVLTNSRHHPSPKPLVEDIGALMLTAQGASSNSLSAASISEAEIDEPDAEGLDPEFVVFPESNPAVDPTPEDLEEPAIVDEFIVPRIYLPLIVRQP